MLDFSPETLGNTPCQERETDRSFLTRSIGSGGPPRLPGVAVPGRPGGEKGNRKTRRSFLNWSGTEDQQVHSGKETVRGHDCRSGCGHWTNPETLRWRYRTQGGPDCRALLPGRGDAWHLTGWLPLFP